MYKFKLSLRYMFKKRVSYLALLSVTLCVFIVVVVMTVMTGLVSDFKEKNHLYTGDCIVKTDSLVGFCYYDKFVERLRRSEVVKAAAVVIRSYGLISAAESERNTGLEIVGVNAESFSRVTGFAESLYYHSDNAASAFAPVYDANVNGFVIGIGLWLERGIDGAYDHESRRAAGSFLVSCFPLTAKGALAGAGTTVVNTRKFYFSDTSISGLARVDSSIIYIDFKMAQELCGMGGEFKRASAVHIKFRNGISVEDGCAAVSKMWERFVAENKGGKYSELFDNVVVQSWQEYGRTFIAAMETEQVMIALMFGLVGITTVFIIFVVFYMIVSHKFKDIGILKSIGASGNGILGLFMNFALMVGILGTSAGMILGCVFLAKINDIEQWLNSRYGFQMWDRSIYAIGDIPNKVDFSVLGVIMFCSVSACILGALVPGWQAGRLEPVEALQVNQI